MKYIALFLALVSSSFAQSTGSNVVNIIPVLASTTITSNQTFTSSPLQNIGQTNHVGILNITAATGSISATCSIEGSVDGTNYQAIGNIVVFALNTAANQQFRFYGYGSYPNIRTKVAVSMSSSPSLTFSISYIGNSIPSNTLVDMSGGASPLTTLLLQSMTGGGVTTTLTIPSQSTQRFNLYGMDIYSDATGTDLVIACSGGRFVKQISNLGTTRTFIFPASLRPYATCPPGDSVTYNLLGTPVVVMNLHYRFE